MLTFRSLKRFLTVGLLFILGMVGVSKGQEQEAPQFSASPRGTSAGETGRVCFYELAANGENTICIKAPDNLGANTELILPWSGTGSSPFIIIQETDGLDAEIHLKGFGNQPSGILKGFQAGGDEGAETATQIGDILSLDGYGWSTAFDSISNVSITLKAIQNFSVSTKGTEIDFSTTPLGTTGKVNQMTLNDVALHTHNVRPKTDSLYSVGTTSLRYVNGFADLWNAEIIQIENAAHDAHYQLTHEVTGLDIKDTSGVSMLFVTPGGQSIIRSNLRPSTADTFTLGTATVPWLFVNSRDFVATNAFVVQSHQSAAFFTCDSLSFAWPICTRNGIFGPNGGINGDARSATLELGNSSDRDILALFIDGGDGRGIWKNDLGNIVVDIGAEVDGTSNNDGALVVKNSVGSNRITLQITSADAGSIFLDNPSGAITAILSGRDGFSGNASGLLDLRDDTGAVNTFIGSRPATGDSYIELMVGAVPKVTLEAFTSGGGNLELLGGTTGDGEGAQLIGITKDGVPMIEADNLSISGDGNFYNYSQAGDKDCSTIDDSWTGFQTTTEELQICSGGVTRLIPSTTIAFSPVTQNCAAGESAIDPRYENGILVESSGCASSSAGAPFVDTTSIVEGSADATKEIRFEVDGLTTATIRVITLQDLNLTMAGIDVAQTWTATQTIPIINSEEINITNVGENRVILDTFGDNGFAHFINDLGNQVAVIGAEGAGGDQADSGHLELADNLGRVKLIAGITSDGDPFIHMRESGAGSSNEILLQAKAAGMAANSFVINNSSGVLRIQGGIIDASEAGASWQVSSAAEHTVSIQSTAVGGTGLHIGSSIHFFEGDFVLGTGKTTGGGEGAQFIGITKDGAPTIEADNFTISADGNFYHKAQTTDKNCFTIDNGWTVLQTVAEELQICSDGVTRLFPSTTIALNPVTLNCADNQTALDPRYDNGILVESDGCSSTILFSGGVDISADTNLTALSPITLVGDQIRCPTCITNGAQTVAGAKTFSSATAFTVGIGTGAASNSTIYIGSSGEFYMRTQSGDLSCGSVTDGFAVIQTTDKELQVCLGGSMVAVALT